MDGAGLNSIPRSMQLAAGRTGQEYNLRKGRQGAFWEDRYHAAAVESGEHFIRCLVYIDLNMVRARVVCHPSEWAFSGYNEIQRPRRKYVLISYDRLMKLAGCTDYESFRKVHSKWVESEIERGRSVREPYWSESIPVVSERFVKNVKNQLASKAKGRQLRPLHRGMELREPVELYNPLFDPENIGIGC